MTPVSSKSSLGLPVSFTDFIENTLKTKEFEILPLAGDASMRKYYRIVHGDRSHVLMSWDPFSPQLQDYPFLSVHAHFAKHKVQVPEVLATAPHLGTIILEDLGDLTLERKFWEQQNQSLVLPFYFQAVDELIKIHYACTKDRSPCTAFGVMFDEEKFVWELNYGLEHLLKRLLGVELSESLEASIKENFHHMARRLASEPKYICHRDYHSRNVMIKLGKCRVIDFQDARLGPIQYDLASLVADPYVSLSSDLTKKILDYYLSERKALKLESLSKDEFKEVFELQVIQRCFKACGTFASCLNLRKDKRYLKHLGPALRTLVKNLEGFSEYQAFKDVLIDFNVVNTDYEALCEPSS